MQEIFRVSIRSSVIETLSQGVFCGKTQDDNGMKNDYKFFHAEIQRPQREHRDYWSKRPKTRIFEGDMDEEIQANFLQIKKEVENIIRISAEKYQVVLEADKARPVPEGYGPPYPSIGSSFSMLILLTRISSS